MINVLDKCPYQEMEISFNMRVIGEKFWKNYKFRNKYSNMQEVNACIVKHFSDNECEYSNLRVRSRLVSDWLEVDISK